MKILVTGCAGFVGFSLTKKLLLSNYQVVGIDNINDYYSRSLKLDRVKELRKLKKKFSFHKVDISNNKKLEKILTKKIDTIVNLAAQAGVRYSISNPELYFKSNVIGFYNLLNIARKKKTNHLIYASTSSVYGESKKFPLKENYSCENPIQ